MLIENLNFTEHLLSSGGEGHVLLQDMPSIPVGLYFSGESDGTRGQKARFHERETIFHIKALHVWTTCYYARGLFSHIVTTSHPSLGKPSLQPHTVHSPELHQDVLADIHLYALSEKDDCIITFKLTRLVPQGMPRDKPQHHPSGLWGKMDVLSHHGSHFGLGWHSCCAK